MDHAPPAEKPRAMKPHAQAVIVPVLRFLATRTTVPMWERFAMWSLVLFCAFSGGNGNHFNVGGEVGAFLVWWHGT